MKIYCRYYKSNVKKTMKSYLSAIRSAQMNLSYILRIQNYYRLAEKHTKEVNLCQKRRFIQEYRIGYNRRKDVQTPNFNMLLSPFFECLENKLSRKSKSRGGSRNKMAKRIHIGID